MEDDMAQSLNSFIDAIADDITLNPSAASVRLRCAGDLVGTCEVDVRIGERVFKVDEPKTVGGTGIAPNPVEYALGSLGACQAITYRYWSEKLGIRFDRLRVEVRGDMDIRGMFGLEEGVHAGLDKVEVQVHLSGPDTLERYEALRRAVDEHCAVLETFVKPVPVRTSLTVT
jgi:putative redox protein